MRLRERPLARLRREHRRLQALRQRLDLRPGIHGPAAQKNQRRLGIRQQLRRPVHSV